MPAERGRGECHQALRQFHHGLVGEARQDHVFQLVQLLLHAIADARVGVAEQVHPPGTHRVQIAFAVEVLQPDAFATPDRNQRQGFVILHLGTGVPEHGEVAPDQVVVLVHG